MKYEVTITAEVWTKSAAAAIDAVERRLTVKPTPDLSDDITVTAASVQDVSHRKGKR